MLIGVDVDPGESVDRISSWGESNGFFWPLAPVSADPLKDYRVSQQSAAVGIDASGENRASQERRAAGRGQVARLAEHARLVSTASAELEVPSTAASIPAAPASVEAVPTVAPAPAAATVAPVTQPVQPAPTVAVAAPTAAAAPTDCAAAVRGSRADYHSVTDSDGEACTDCDAVTGSHANAQATAAFGFRGR